MSGITDFPTLRATVRDYLNHVTLTDAQLDIFLDNGRRSAAQFLAREQEAVADLTLDADLAAPVPPRFLAARVAYLFDGRAISEQGTVFAPADAPGYRILAGNFEIVGDAQGQITAGDIVTLHYYEFPEMLSDAVPVSAYLTANPDLWLWAAVADGARFLDNRSLMQGAQAAMTEIGPRVRALASSGRQWGGPRKMVVRT